MSHLSAKNIGITRWGKILQEGISFELNPGQLLVIKGANGSGKTTLLKTLAGIFETEHGSLKHGWHVKKNFLGHENALLPSISILNNLNYWYKSGHGIAPHDALQRVGLEKLQERLPMTLSAGQQRRAGLARLLVHKADVWLLDEPYATLDQRGQDILWDMLQEHMSSGGSAVIASHAVIPILDKQTLELK